MVEQIVLNFERACPVTCVRQNHAAPEAQRLIEIDITLGFQMRIHVGLHLQGRSNMRVDFGVFSGWCMFTKGVHPMGE